MDCSWLAFDDASICSDSRNRIVWFLDHIRSLAMMSTLSKMPLGIRTEVTIVVLLLLFVVFMTTSYYKTLH